jgi:hypothetical protein
VGGGGEGGGRHDGGGDREEGGGEARGVDGDVRRRRSRCRDGWWISVNGDVQG